MDIHKSNNNQAKIIKNHGLSSKDILVIVP
jgi:hypothetical protein